MNLPELSIKRPIFITCVFLLMIIVGMLSLKRLPIDILPKVSFPFVSVNTSYDGASPEEVETLLTKPIEDVISSISGLKRLLSVSKNGYSQILAEFKMDSDIKDVEQQIRSKIAGIKDRLPWDAKEPNISRIDPDSQPFLILGLTADLPEQELYQLAKHTISPILEQVDQVGFVDITGGCKREIRVKLDVKKLKERDLSASQVVQRLGGSGQNTPTGKLESDGKETSYRVIGEFHAIKDIASTIVNFRGNEVPTVVGDVAEVIDGFEAQASYSYLNDKKALLFTVFRQPGSNTVAIANAVHKRIKSLNEELSSRPGSPKITIHFDLSKYIKMNIDDVKESIYIGIGLTVVVVFLCLGNFRSTFITSLALPNSILGAFLLMAIAGFSINMMTLLALSLSIGLLIDDAIVVRENIFRYMARGLAPKEAALKGSKEMQLAVIATTATVMAVFGSMGFLKGSVGQFFKEFGLTVCFAMLISLLDSLTMAPMLSAYLGGSSSSKPKQINKPELSERFFTALGNVYANLLRRMLKRPWLPILGASLIFVGGVLLIPFIPTCFVPPSNNSQFCIQMHLPVGSSLEKNREISLQINQMLHTHPEVEEAVFVIGSQSEANKTTCYVTLVPEEKRLIKTVDFQEILREDLKAFAFAKPKITEAGQEDEASPFSVLIMGDNDDAVAKTAARLYDKLKDHPSLKDVELSENDGGDEIQFHLDDAKMRHLGITAPEASNELRTLIAGTVVGVYRDHHHEYNIRVHAKEEQQELKSNSEILYVPNINGSLINVNDFGSLLEEQGPAAIYRKNRAKYISISAELAPKGPGIGAAIQDVNNLMTGELKPPAGVTYSFQGDAEVFEELASEMIIALFLGVLFIYCVLASLYESFITPFTIMLVLPLALCGAFYALFVTQESLNVYSMIGCIMLLGVATKNSILLVDYSNQLIADGMEKIDAIVEAGRSRLRPILMTSLALIAGMLPIAIGLNEASKQRASMSIAIIGGLITSTLLSLIVIPAAYSYLHRLSVWIGSLMRPRKTIQSSG